MSTENLRTQISTIFEETGTAHHQAFQETDGYDPDWAEWYAEHAQSRLARVSGYHVSKPELARFFSEAEEKQAHEAPEENWTQFFADYFIDRYNEDKDG